MKKKVKKHPSKLAVHFSSKRGDHGSPDWIYKKCDEKFNFKADLAADAKNKKHPTYFSVKNSALDAEWPKGYSYCNPPYGKGLIKWARKAKEQMEKGANCLMLLPARTDTKWYHEYVLPFAKQVVFIKGRLTFKGEPAPAPFPSMLVLWEKRKEGADLEMRALTQQKKEKNGRKR